MDSFFTYQNFVLDRVQLKEPFVTGNAHDDATLLAYTGLAGEAGEVADWHKKNLFHKRKLPKEDLLLEMGDVLWYFVLMLHQHGFTLEQVMKANMKKLQERDRQRQHAEELAKIRGSTAEHNARRPDDKESRATPFPQKSTLDKVREAMGEARVEARPNPFMTDQVMDAVYGLFSGPVAVQGRGGHNTTYNISVGLLQRGLTTAECFTALTAKYGGQSWNDRCSPPWEEEELWTIVDNASRYMTKQKIDEAFDHGEDDPVVEKIEEGLRRIEVDPQPAMPFVPPTFDTMAAHTGEQVQVSATGGLRFNVGKNRMDLIPPEWLWALGDVLTKGALKYESRNWEKGLGWSDMIGCTMRHVAKFQAGERYDGPGYDKEKGTTGCHHLAMAAWNLLSLMTYDLRGIGTNDLPDAVTIELLCSVNAETAPKTTH